MQRHSSWAQLHAPRRAIEQAHSELELELPHCLGQPGLREMQALGCPAEMQLFSENQESLQVAAIDDRRRIGCMPASDAISTSQEKRPLKQQLSTRRAVSRAIDRQRQTSSPSS